GGADQDGVPENALTSRTDDDAQGNGSKEEQEEQEDSETEPGKSGDGNEGVTVDVEGSRASADDKNEPGDAGGVEDEKNKGEGAVAVHVEVEPEDGEVSAQRKLNELVQASIARTDEQACNVAFVKTHKTASTTVTSMLYRYGIRHGRRVARFDVEGTAVTLEKSVQQ
ncbi:unnamed protein product, partial [Sphacelaria rigidula]